MITDKQKTQLQETGYVVLNYWVTLAQVVETVNELGIDPREIELAGEIDGHVTLSVFSRDQVVS